MREIKFRARMAHYDGWAYGNLLLSKDGGASIWPIESNKISDVKDVGNDTIGQYTGLKDKSGKEIYEGDVVEGTFNIKIGEYKIRKHSYAKYTDKKIKCVINYTNGCFWANSDFKVFYKTSFYRGVGSTKAEKRYHEFIETYTDFNKCLSEVLNKIEVIGNIYEHPDLLEQ